MRSLLRVYVPIMAISLVSVQLRSIAAAVIAADDFSSYWVDPDSSDYYDSQTGANSADAVTAWGVPTGGITQFVNYSLIRNMLDDVEFDDVVFAASASDVGVNRVTDTSTAVGRFTWGQLKAEYSQGR